MISSLGSIAYSEIPVLKSRRLLLRAYRINDFADAAGMWGDAAVTRYIGGTPRGRRDVWMAIQRHAGSWPLMGYGYWAIEEQATGNYVGEVGFQEGMRDIDPPIGGVPEAGWCLSPSFWSRGYASEALATACNWLDETYRSEAVCIIQAENLASLSVAKKASFEVAHQTSLAGEDTIILRRPALVDAATQSG